jgi:DNA repair protein RadC
MKSYYCRVIAMLPLAQPATGPKIERPEQVVEYCKDLADLGQESFQVLTLTQKNQVIGRHMVSLGSLTGSLVHPREVYRPALLDNSAAVMLIHNHPSSDPQPSKDDKALTVRLIQAGEILGIRVLDHVIIGHGQHYSFVEAGLI